MRGGELRQRITLQIPQRSTNDMGETIDTFVDWATTWAAIEPLTGRRYMEAKQANAEASGICRIRYRHGVLPTMRITFEGRTFDIVSVVQPKERKEELHLYYKERLD